MSNNGTGLKSSPGCVGLTCIFRVYSFMVQDTTNFVGNTEETVLSKEPLPKGASVLWQPVGGQPALATPKDMSAKSSLPACTDVNGGENCTNKSNSTAYTYKKPGSYMMGATITYTDKNGKKVSKTLDPINVNPSLATSSTCFDTNKPQFGIIS